MKSLHLHLAVIFFAACQQSCEKVILSALCVCHSVCSYSGVPYEATPQRPTVQGLDLGFHILRHVQLRPPCTGPPACPNCLRAGAGIRVKCFPCLKDLFLHDQILNRQLDLDIAYKRKQKIIQKKMGLPAMALTKSRWVLLMVVSRRSCSLNVMAMCCDSCGLRIFRSISSLHVSTGDMLPVWRTIMLRPKAEATPEFWETRMGTPAAAAARTSVPNRTESDTKGCMNRLLRFSCRFILRSFLLEDIRSSALTSGFLDQG